MIYYDEISTITDSEEVSEENIEEVTEETTEVVGSPTDALILEELREVNSNLYNFYNVFIFAFLMILILNCHKILHYVMKRHTDF